MLLHLLIILIWLAVLVNQLNSNREVPKIVFALSVVTIILSQIVHITGGM